MGDDLQAMVDRMTLKGGVEGPDVEAVAVLIQQRLGVSLCPQDYVQLANQFIRFSINKQQDKQPQERDEKDDGQDSEKEANRFASSSPPRCEAGGVQSVGTWSTSESAGSSESSQSEPQQETPRGKNRAHDMDGPGASQPARARSPVPPPRQSQFSPARRPRPASRPSSRARNVRSSPSRSMPTTSTFTFYPFPNTAPKADHDNPFLETFAPKQEPAKDHAIKLFPTPTTSPRRPASPLTPVPPETPHASSSPPLNRPGLQEDDATGLAHSPQNCFASASPGLAARRTEAPTADFSRDKPLFGAEEKPGEAPTADFYNYKPLLGAEVKPGVFDYLDKPPFGAEVKPGVTGTASKSFESATTPKLFESAPTSTVEAIDPDQVDLDQVDDPMSTTPMGDLFTPPGRYGASDKFNFHTGKNKNRRKDGTPFIDEMKADSSIASPRAGFCQDATNSLASNLGQPSLSHANGTRGDQEKSETQGCLFSSFQAGNGVSFQAENGVGSEFAFTLGSTTTNSRRNPRKQVRRPQNVSTSSVGANSNSSAALFDNVPQAPPLSPFNSPVTMEVDPLTPRATPNANETKQTCQETLFQMGVSGGGSSRKAKLGPKIRVNGSSMTNSPVSPRWPEVGLMPSKPQSLRRVEPDFTGTKDMIFSIKEEARDFYMKGNYGESIRHYTRAIKVLYDSSVRLQLGDLLAVLYSNRAAALMMIGAYEASSADCVDGLSYVSKSGENVENFSTDSGPPLTVKLQTRLGRALLKQGDHEGARKAFEVAISVAHGAINFCCRFLGPSEYRQNETQLNQMITEATLGRSDADRLRVAMDNVVASMQQIQKDSSSRRAFSDALTHVGTALSIASGSLFLYERNVIILSKMKRWRETALFCERIAASHSRMGGMFVGDLEGKIPFPVSSAPEHLVPGLFSDTSEENAETADRKLNSKASAEAVFWLPATIIPIYLRSLRLEERYPAADACLAALENFVKVGSPRFSPVDLKREFSWLRDERSKLIRTKTGREKGDDHFKCSDYELAAAHYANALNIDAEGLVDRVEGPNAGGRLHAVLHCNRAACLMAMKRYKDALEECTAALRIHSRYMKAMLRRARCYCRLFRYQEAISEYKQWVDLVEEARRVPAGSIGYITPCLFDGPRDVTPDAFAEVTKELEGVYATRRKAEATAREEEAWRSDRQQRRSNKDFSASGSARVDRETAQQRRDQWQNNNEGARRWDSFRNQGPRPTGARARSSSRRDPDGINGNNSSSRSQRSGDPIPPMDPSDHYSVLGISMQASDDEIKKSYRKMALRYHPDKNKADDADKKFQLIQTAYETLSDPNSRNQYDRDRGYNNQRWRF